MHHLVDVVDGNEQSLEDVHALERLVEVELRATGDHIDLVIDVVAQHLGKGEGAGHAVDEREVDDTEVGLQLGALVEVVEHDLGHGTTLEIDDDAHALTVGLVAHVGDALDMLLVDLLRDALLKGALVDLIGDLGYHEPLAASCRYSRHGPWRAR